MVPTRRRVYVRNPDGSPQLESTSIAIEFSDVTFSLKSDPDGIVCRRRLAVGA